MSKLTKVYEELALERRHECAGCGTQRYLSHSHLIARGYRKDMEIIKENIVYHCLDMANGCHTKWEGIGAPLLRDFIPNMVYVFKSDPPYFWRKFHKIQDFWAAEKVGISEKATDLAIINCRVVIKQLLKIVQEIEELAQSI